MVFIISNYLMLICYTFQSMKIFKIFTFYIFICPFEKHFVDTQEFKLWQYLQKRKWIKQACETSFFFGTYIYTTFKNVHPRCIFYSTICTFNIFFALTWKIEVEHSIQFQKFLNLINFFCKLHDSWPHFLKKNLYI